jgi:hypothetical protein
MHYKQQHLAEAARHDPDNREYVALLRRGRAMESTKDKGNKAYGAGKLQEAIAAWTEVCTHSIHYVL